MSNNNDKGLKIIAWTGGLALFGWLAFKGVQLYLEASSFLKQLKYNIVNLSGGIFYKKGENLWENIVNAITKPYIKIQFDVEFYNPTKTQISGIERPNITIKYKGNDLAQSKVVTDKDEKITIKPQGKSYARNFVFEIDIASKISLIYDMVKQVTSGITINQNDTAVNKAIAIAGQLNDNLIKKLYPLIDVNLLTYVGNSTIDVTFNLA